MLETQTTYRNQSSMARDTDTYTDSDTRQGISKKTGTRTRKGTRQKQINNLTFILYQGKHSYM